MAKGSSLGLSAVAVAALGLLGVALVLWLEPGPAQPGVVLTRPDAAVSAQPGPAPGAVPAPVAAGVSTGVAAAGGPPVAMVPGAPPADPAALFVAAIEAARQAPQPPPPPGVANARSLPEAFEAMRAAQGEPRSASAGVSPFGAPVAK